MDICPQVLRHRRSTSAVQTYSAYHWACGVAQEAEVRRGRRRQCTRLRRKEESSFRVARAAGAVRQRSVSAMMAGCKVSCAAQGIRHAASCNCHWTVVGLTICDIAHVPETFAGKCLIQTCNGRLLMALAARQTRDVVDLLLIGN